MASRPRPSLRLMRPGEFDAFISKVQTDYARNYAFAEGMHRRYAQSLSEDRMYALLPEGLSSKNHFIYSVVLNDGKEPIGWIWYRMQEHEGELHAFMMDIYIDEASRMDDVEQACIELFEDRIKTAGAIASHMSLFAHNSRGRLLAQQNGYLPSEMSYAKRLV